MTPPKGLGAVGKALWKSVLKDLPDGWDLDHRELEIPPLAGRWVDEREALLASMGRLDRALRHVRHMEGFRKESSTK